MNGYRSSLFGSINRTRELTCPQSVVKQQLPVVREINPMLKKELSPAEVDRVIQMAWEDRTSFDAIQNQFGLTSGEVIHLMRRELSASSFRLWRKRTAGRKTKHVAKRGFEVGRFRCSNQKGS